MIGEPRFTIKHDMIDFTRLSSNTNPLAIKILKENLDKINWLLLSGNSSAIELINNNLDKISSLHLLSSNVNAIHIIEKNLDKIDWKELSYNKNAIHILEKNLDKVNWRILSANPNAIKILENNLDKIDWNTLSSNKNAIHILEQNLDKVNWDYLSGNPNAIHLLENNLDKICILGLCANENPKAIKLLETIIEPNKHHPWFGLTRTPWWNLCINPAAIELCKKYPSRVIKCRLLENPKYIYHYKYSYEYRNSSDPWDMSENPNSIYLLIKFEYEIMKENNKDFAEELVAYVFNPNRLIRFGKKYGFEIWDVDDLY